VSRKLWKGKEKRMKKMEIGGKKKVRVGNAEDRK